MKPPAFLSRAREDVVTICASFICHISVRWKKKIAANRIHRKDKEIVRELSDSRVQCIRWSVNFDIEKTLYAWRCRLLTVVSHPHQVRDMREIFFRKCNKIRSSSREMRKGQRQPTTQNEYLSRLKTSDDDENEQHENKHHSLLHSSLNTFQFRLWLHSAFFFVHFSLSLGARTCRVKEFFHFTIPRPFLCQLGMLFQFLSWFVKVLIFHVHDH